MAEPSCVGCGGLAFDVVRPYRSLKPAATFADLTVARCRGCRLQAAHPMPSQAALDHYYAGGSYDSGNAALARQASRWERLPARAHSQVRFHRTASPAPIGSWLDVGAGYGFLLDEARRAGAGRTAAIEATPSRVEHLVANGHEIIASLDDLEPGQWDVISASHLLEHVADPVAFVGRIAGGLAPGGHLFCEVPNAVAWPGSHDDPHVTFFSPETLGAVIVRAGLRLDRLATAGPVVERHRILRGVEARAWGVVRSLRLPERTAAIQPEYRSSPVKRLVIRAVASVPPGLA